MYLPVAAKWWRKAAEQGDTLGQFNLGDCYRDGTGVEKNLTEVVKSYRKAAEQGNADAQFNLGVCYDDGEGVEKSLTEAVKWYRKAAEQGTTEAQFNLGVCYRNGTGVEKNNEEAAKWYRAAAEHGDASAQLNLGACYYKGEGVEKSLTEAVKWYRKAAEQGNAKAQFNLGVRYRDGTGVEKNNEEAVRWFRKAAEQGNVNAQASLGDLFAGFKPTPSQPATPDPTAPPASAGGALATAPPPSTKSAQPMPSQAAAKPKPYSKTYLAAVAASVARAKAKCPKAFEPGTAQQSAFMDFAFHFDQTKPGWWRKQSDWPEQLVDLATHYSPRAEWHAARLAQEGKEAAKPETMEALVERRLAEMKAEEEKMPGYFSPEDQERHRKESEQSAQIVIPGLSVEDVNAPAREAQRQAQAHQARQKAAQDASYADWVARVQLQEQRDREAAQQQAAAEREQQQIAAEQNRRLYEEAEEAVYQKQRSRQIGDPMMHPHGSRAPDGVDPQWYYEQGEQRWAAQQAAAAAAQAAAAQQQLDWQMQQQKQKLEELERKLRNR